MTAKTEDGDESMVLGRPYPERLYKYRRLDVRSLSAVARNRHYFGDYTLFNDPFDCQAGRPLDLLIQESQRRGLDNEFTGLATFRICCFSAVPDDILMWGHYGDSYQGFCMEFTPENDPNFKRMCLPVTYQKQFPDLLTPHPETKGQNGAAILKLLTTKSEHWSYEEEWRMVMHVPKGDGSSHGGEEPYKPEALTGIIFGMRMPQDHRMLLNTLTASLPHLRKYETHKDESDYALRIRDRTRNEKGNEKGVRTIYAENRSDLAPRKLGRGG